MLKVKLTNCSYNIQTESCGTMASISIITNNDAVTLFFKQYKGPEAPEVIFIDAAAVRVFQAAKEAAQRGARLLVSPLSASDEKCESPFKTLIIAPPDIAPPEGEGIVIHFQSIALIESASRAYTKAAKNRFRAYTDDNIKEFKKLDLELMLSGLQEVIRSLI